MLLSSPQSSSLCREGERVAQRERKSLNSYVEQDGGAFNPTTQETEAEAGEPLNLRPVWSTELVSGQPGLHRKALSRKTKTKTVRMQNLGKGQMTDLEAMASCCVNEGLMNVLTLTHKGQDRCESGPLTKRQRTVCMLSLLSETKSRLSL